MRRFLNLLRSRAGHVLGGAVVTMLLLPATALAGGFAAPGGLHHRAATGAAGLGGVAIFLGILGAGTLCVVVASRLGGNSRPRVAKGVQRKPLGVASK